MLVRRKWLIATLILSAVLTVAIEAKPAPGCVELGGHFDTKCQDVAYLLPCVTICHLPEARR